MKKFASLLIVTILIQPWVTSCKSPETIRDEECRTDEKFILNYKNCLLVMAKTRYGYGVKFQDRFRAIECLEAITCLDSYIIKGNDAPYLLYQTDPNMPENDLFNEDMKQWHYWLSNNKCNYTMEEAEKAIEVRGVQIGTELDWPSSFYGDK